MRLSVRLSLSCICGLLIVPFLIPYHYNPIRTFMQEWVAAGLGLLLVTSVWIQEFRHERTVEIPKIGLLPLGLIGLVLAQVVLGRAQSNSQALLFALYLLWSFFIVVSVHNLQLFVSREKIAMTAAYSVLAGALCSSIVLVMQITKTGLSSGLIFPLNPGGGNLAQHNHLANYLWLGIVSALFLNLKQCFGAKLLIAITFVLATASSLTGSRSIILYAIAIPALSFWAAFRFSSQEFKRTAFISLVLCGFVIFLQWLFAHNNFGQTYNIPTTGERLITEMSGGSIRLQLWRTGLSIFFENPWLGAGIGHFPYYAYLKVGSLNDGTFIGGGEHAHNVFIQLLSELGIAAPILLLSFGWLWWHTFIRGRWAPSDWWVAGVLAILATHSQLEYPLWYAFFLGAASIVVGLGHLEVFRLQLNRKALRLAVLLILVLGLTTLHSLFSSYKELERILHGGLDASRSAPNVISENIRNLSQIQRESLYSDYVPFTYAILMDTDRSNLRDKIAVCQNAIRFSPLNIVVYKLAWLLALDEKGPEAIQALQRAIATHPSYIPTAKRELAALTRDFPEIGWLSTEFDRLTVQTKRK